MAQPLPFAFTAAQKVVASATLAKPPVRRRQKVWPSTSTFVTSGWRDPNRSGSADCRRCHSCIAPSLEFMAASCTSVAVPVPMAAGGGAAVEAAASCKGGGAGGGSGRPLAARTGGGGGVLAATATGLAGVGADAAGGGFCSACRSGVSGGGASAGAAVD